ncbi:MAG: YfhO family protein, partial [Patescibacteria group bacterium]
IRASQDGKIVKTFTHINRSVAEIAPGYGTEDLPNNQYRLRIMDALAVKYILDRVENPKDDATFPPNRFTKIWDNSDGWSLYQNMHAAPRYFLADRIEYYSTDAEFESLFFSPGFNPKNTVLLENREKSFINVLPANQKNVELISYEPNTVRFQTHADTPQLLYLSDTYDKGWKSSIDGKQAVTLKANFALRAVLIPAGSHTVVMNYLPDEFILGATVSLVGLTLFALYLTIGSRYHVKTRS